MAAKHVHFSTEARDGMLRGVNILANAVRVTLGPKGRNVIIEKSFGAPRSTKDGVTVAKEIELTDKFENLGAQLIREVASKTSEKAGDGTTTATVLAQAIVVEGLKSVAAGMNPMDLRRGIDKAVIAVSDAIKASSRKVTTNDEIAQVGAISANGDKEVGDMTALSMPRLRSIGFMPAATDFRPSTTMAWANTVAVVVPSPALSLVWEATSRMSWAPRFSNLSSSSISLATVTPSLVVRGAP